LNLRENRIDKPEKYAVRRHERVVLTSQAIISVGIILSFAWTAFLAWLVVCALAGLI
jgi:hypothetical protein